MIKTRGDHQLLRSQDSESDENEFVTFNQNNHTSALVNQNASTTISSSAQKQQQPQKQYQQ